MKTIPQFEMSAPEAEGISSTTIKGFVDEVEQTVHDLHSFVLIRHGHLVAEGWWGPYGADDPHILFSLSKSFTSTAVGIAIDEGKLHLDDPVISFFPEETPAEVSENLGAMQVRHLLSMSTGHGVAPTQELYKPSRNTWVQTFLSQPIDHTPGTFFVYNTGATYVLSAIVQKVSGQPLIEYLKPRLFEPLGIEHPTWEVSPQGINTGGFGLSIRTRDIAQFGQLYLQKGQWQGKSILSPEWVETATTQHITNPNSNWGQGYGWRTQHGNYRADGAFGQYCLVLPEKDAVLAITSGTQDMQAVLDLIWKHLLSGMETASLPTNPAAHLEIEQKLTHLQIKPVQGEATAQVANQIGGRRFIFEDNEQQIKTLTFNFDDTGANIEIENELGSSKLGVGYGIWRKDLSAIDGQGERKVGASGAWTGPDTFSVQLYFVTPVLTEEPPMEAARRIPFGLHITFRFIGDMVVMKQRPNQSHYPDKWPELTGRLVGL